MTDENLITRELDEDGIAIVRIDNPAQRNAISREMMRGLAVIFEDLAADPACRAIVLTGAGSTFSSGANVAGFNIERPINPTRAMMRDSQRLIRAILAEKPVISAVEGLAFGAGVSLAVASDHVVAAENSRFGFAFAKVGLIADLGLFHTLPMRVGVARAKRMLVMGEVVDAAEALRTGLADELVPAGQVLETALARARAYLSVAPIPLALTKAVYAGGIPSLEQAFKHESDFQPMAFNTEDHRNAVAAFMEKRTPEFRGR